MMINKILEVLKQLQGHVHYIGEDIFGEWSFEYDKPATEDEIELFEKTIAILPDDYKEFLKTTNGMSFCTGSLYSLEWIVKVRETMDFKKGIYPIGYVLEDYIVIKSDEIPSGNYMYVGYAYASDEYFSLHCSFETFFDRFTIISGDNFWTWQECWEEMYDFLY